MASESHLFLCNGAELARAAKAWKSAKSETLTTGKNGSVRIAIPALTRRMVSNVRDVIADLTEIAAFVFAADQAVSRSGNKKFDYGDKWIRDFRFEIAIRCPDFWNQSHVLDCLSETLHFLTADNFEFRFSKNHTPTPFSSFLGFGDANPEGIQRIVLFSGGLDSLTGAVEEILHDQRKVALVSHRPVSHLGTRQAALVKKLTERIPNKEQTPLHLMITANKSGQLDHDATQRTRSFLFASLGAAVAEIFKIDGIEFYENGIVSVNLPLCDQEMNARASRTTHPQSIHRLKQLLSHVWNGPFDVRNHYLDLTKQDVVQRLQQLGHADLISSTVSCSHTRKTNHDKPHCGLCSQCLSRRFATLGANVENYDPESQYRESPLSGSRPNTPERILAERFIGVARQIETMASPQAFQRAFAADLGRITPYLEGTSRDVIARLFELHHRHASQIARVVKSQMKQYAGSFWDGDLSNDCALWYAFDVARSQRTYVAKWSNEDPRELRNHDICQEIQNQVDKLNEKNGISCKQSGKSNWIPTLTIFLVNRRSPLGPDMIVTPPLRPLSLA